jgi:hypothetical protein
MAALGVYLMAAGLLVVAGAAKAARPADTARALSSLFPRVPVRRWRPLVRALAAAEAAVGVVAVAFPGRVPATVVAASYAAFTAFVLVARSRGGSLASCGCFGTPDTPPTVGHAVVTAILAAGAVVVAWAAPGGGVAGVLGHQYGHGVPLVAASVVGGWFAFLVMAPLARLAALRAAAPYVPGGRP